MLDKGRSRGTFRLEDLRARQGYFAVEVEGDGEAFHALLEARGVGISPAEHSVPGATSPEGAGRTSWVTALPEGDGAAALLLLARESGVRVRRVAPLMEDLEEVFHRLLSPEGGR